MKTCLYLFLTFLLVSQTLTAQDTTTIIPDGTMGEALEPRDTLEKSGFPKT